MALNVITHITLDNTILVNNFEKLEVHQPMRGHHTAEIVLNSELLAGPSAGALHEIKSYLGKNLEIIIKPAERAGDEFRFLGIITAVSVENHDGSMQSRCVIKAGSPTVLLDDLPHIETYEEKNLAGIVQRLLSHYPANFARTVSPANNGKLEFIVQYKENTFHFLSRICARFGEWLYYDGEELCVGIRKAGNIAPLIPGINLSYWRIQLNTAPVNTQFTAYDYEKDMQVNDATGAHRPDNLDEYSAFALQQNEMLYSKQALHTISQSLGNDPSTALSAITKLVSYNSAAGMVTGEGKSDHTGLAPGREVQLNRSGSDASGGESYMITKVSHYCTGSGEYRNSFKAIPAAAAVPYGDINAFPEAEAQSATVTDNNDPAGLGRIRVRFRWQQAGVSPWLRLVSASGGSDKGFYMIPETGEEVMVDFENGNPELPYVIGTFYNGSAKSSFGGAGNNMKALRTRSGNTILMNDGDGSISMNDPAGACIKLLGNGTLEICAPEKILFNTKKVDVAATQKITMAEDKMIIDVSGNKIDKNARDVTITTTNTTIKSSTLTKIDGESKFTGDTTIKENITVQGSDITITGMVNMN